MTIARALFVLLVAAFFANFSAFAQEATEDYKPVSEAEFRDKLYVDVLDRRLVGYSDLDESIRRSVDTAVGKLFEIAGSNVEGGHDGCQTIIYRDDDGMPTGGYTSCFTCNDKGCCKCEVNIPPSAGDTCTQGCGD